MVIPTYIQALIFTTAIREDYFKNTGVQVNESGHKGQGIMVPIIQNHLKSADLDDCLLVIHKYIEWYVYDVAVMELRKQGGNRYANYYFNSLVKFIQQFILCAAHQTHAKFEKSIIPIMEPQQINEPAPTDDEADDEERGWNGFLRY